MFSLLKFKFKFKIQFYIITVVTYWDSTDGLEDAQAAGNTVRGCILLSHIDPVE